MPHRDPQNIQECIYKTRHCFSQCKVHLIHKEKDCKDLVFESVLVVLHDKVKIKSLKSDDLLVVIL